VEKLDAIADRGYFSGEEILACENAGITVTLPKPMTSNSKAEGRFGKQDFHYVGGADVYICPAGETLPYRYTTEEIGLILHRYWTNACQAYPIKQACTTAKERRITRWEHERVLEAVQRRLDEHSSSATTCCPALRARSSLRTTTTDLLSGLGAPRAMRWRSTPTRSSHHSPLLR
jgi:hypothetical protein